MKKSILYFFLSSMLLSSCSKNDEVDINTFYDQYGNRMEMNESFDCVTLDAPFDINFIEGPQDGVFIKGSEEIAGIVEVRVLDGMLIISKNPDFEVFGDIDDLNLSVNIVAHNLKNIINASDEGDIHFITPVIDQFDMTIAGKGDIEIEEPLIVNKSASFFVSGQGEIEIENISSPSIYCTITGQGKMDIDGVTNYFECVGSGKGEIDAIDLESVESNFTLSGNMQCSTNTVEHISAMMSGNSNLYYIGKPDIDAENHGNSEIVDINTFY